MSIVKAIKSNYGKYIARGVGAAALYFVAKDAHAFAKTQADADVKTKDAKAVQHYLMNTMTLDKPSVTKEKMQDAVFRFELNENYRGFFNAIVGYFKGFGAMLVSNVIPLGLGLTALFAKNKSLAKAGAWGLAGVGLITFLKDGLGIGKNHDLTNSINQDV